jgi:hypothetical protein
MEISRVHMNVDRTTGTIETSLGSVARRFTLPLVALVCWSSPLAGQEHGQFQLVLELNYVSAEKTIDLYRGLSGRPSEIAELRGSQLAMQTTGLLAHRKLDLSGLERALEAAKFNQNLGDDVYRMKEARDSVGPLAELYNELRRRNFGQKVASTVEQLFPAGAKVRGTLPIYFVAFGHQNIDAFVRRVIWHGDQPLFAREQEGEPTIVVNLAKAVHYGRTLDERFLGLLSTVAHEVFHAAFDAYKDESPLWRDYYARRPSYFDALTDLAQNEGIAYYLSLIQSSRGRLPADWEQRVANVFASFNRSAEELLAPGLTPARAQELLLSANTSGYWESYGAMAGMVMAKQIDQGLGRGALAETIANGPMDFFRKYIDLMRRSPSMPLLSSRVVQAIQNTSRR